MPSPLAALLYTLAIIGLLVRDVVKNPGVSHATWVPVIWFLIIGSRLPTEWLGGSPSGNANAYLDGSPIDRAVFLILMVIGAAILFTRTIEWGRFFSDNAAITIFFAYALISIVWSDFPLVAFKRWQKVTGHVIMVLIVLTDPEPTKAFAALFRRCAFVLLPLSALFIKYYPQLGRGFDQWTGAAANSGVATTKNQLGNLCLLLIAIFPASWFARAKGDKGARFDGWVDVLFLAMTIWLLDMADSTAATVAGLLGVALVCVLQIRFLRRQFTIYLVIGLAVATLLLTTTNIKDQVILGLGEDTTLTGRTDLWEDLKKIDVNPIVGVGFESFWVGDRVDRLWAKYWWHPNQAHNGYYEQYLNLGILGLVTLAAMIVAGYRKARKEMLVDPPAGVSADDTRLERNMAYFKLAFLFGVLAFNLTDATFKALHPSFFAFFAVTLGYPRPVRVAAPAGQRASTTRVSLPGLRMPAPALSPLRRKGGPWVNG